MENEKRKILFVMEDGDSSRIIELILEQADFQVVRQETSQNLSSVISQVKPKLIIIEQQKFKQIDVHEIFLNCKQQRNPIYTIVFCESYFRFDPIRDVKEFMKGGVYDYLRSPYDPMEIIEVVKSALGRKENTAFSPTIVEKLLLEMAKSEISRRKYMTRCSWYEKHQQEPACDCQEQVGSEQNPSYHTYRRPLSTSFRKLGRAYDGFYDGDKYICDVCGTEWFASESHTESEFLVSWQLADDTIQ